MRLKEKPDDSFILLYIQNDAPDVLAFNSLRENVSLKDSSINVDEFFSYILLAYILHNISNKYKRIPIMYIFYITSVILNNSHYKYKF